MDIFDNNTEIHILGKLSGDFSVSPDGSKILYITNIKNGQYQHIGVLIYDVKTSTTVTVNEIETLYWWIYYGGHHWTYFQKLNNIWVVDIQFNPFLYPGSDVFSIDGTNNIVPKANSSTMIRINLETGNFERLPAPFPDKHLIHIPLNNYDHSTYKIKVIRDGFSNNTGSLTNKCGIYHNNNIIKEISHNNIINICYMLENGAFTVSSGNNECKLTYL